MEMTDLLTSLSSAIGPAGNECGAFQAAKALLDPIGPCEQTPLGALVCRIKKAGPDKPHLLLTAHMDEIGMIVTFIDDKGFLRIGGTGGVDRGVLLASEVTVHTAGGDLPGVVCTVPPHLSEDDSKLPKLDEICIDVGLDAKAARDKVAPGDRVTWCFEPGVLLDGSVCTKAADDRAGCAAVLLAAQALAGEPLDCSLTVLLSTMEEVGGQGAQTGAQALAPTHAIAVDVSFAYTPDAKRFQCGELGKGVMIGAAPILDNAMFGKLQALSKEKGIPYQIEAMGGSTTGTDADGVAIAGAGVRCAILSIPLKYMHTPVEVVLPADIQALADLITAYARSEFGGGHDGI